MKNIDRQKQLDKRKYLKSESLNTDLSGRMKYCFTCPMQKIFDKNFNYITPICCKSQEKREQYNLCAKAYNRLYRKNNI